jgi:hypothetical protein
MAGQEIWQKGISGVLVALMMIGSFPDFVLFAFGNWYGRSHDIGKVVEYAIDRTLVLGFCLPLPTGLTVAVIVIVVEKRNSE